MPTTAKLDIEDVIATALDEALRDQGFASICNQPYAQELHDRAVYELHMSDLSVQQAARASVQYWREWLAPGTWGPTR